MAEYEDTDKGPANPSGQALAAGEGALKWRYQTGSAVWSSPAIGADGTVYVGSDDGYIYALYADGTLKWRYQTGNWVISSPAIGADGTVYVGSDDQYLYALNSSSLGLANSPWPMFRYDVKHTGSVQALANFIATPSSGFAPLTVQFTDTSTGEINVWVWSFGDGGSSTLQNPNHIYKKPGSFNATLTVSGPWGTGSKSETITAYKKGAPKAKFTVSTKSGPAPLQVQFTNSSTGWITGYAWNFGDSSTSTEASPIHTYNSPGKYKATLTVTGPGGVKSKSATIKVTP